MTAYSKKPCNYRSGNKSLVMLLVFVFFSNLLFSQNLTISLKNVSLEKAFREVEKKVEQRFVYTKEMLTESRPVTLEANDLPLQTVLNLIFQNQPLEFSIDARFITVRFKSIQPGQITNHNPGFDINGKVTNEKGKALTGVSVIVKRTGFGTATNDMGSFHLPQLILGDVLKFTSVGFREKEITIKGNTYLDIQLDMSIDELDQAVIIGYGKTTRRLNTGSVTKVTSEEISRQPVSNPISTLQGKVTGLLVEQVNGIPGSEVRVLLRGQNSLRQGTGPLYIVDGVPFMVNNGTLAQITNPVNHSPLSSLNFSDIESIEVLKDADATAIYGSQAANGVILITTKKGKEGSIKLDVNFYTGIAKVTRTLDLLNTSEYIQMRKEAFANDNVVATPSNAPDLFIWDSTRNIDWKNKIIGGNALTSNLQLSLSGGNAGTRFLFSTNYYSANTVFPNDRPDKKASARLSITHASSNNKFQALFSSAYSFYSKKFPFNDLTPFIYLPPNTPEPYDSLGKLNWVNYVTGIDNPFAQLQQQYSSETNSLIANSVLQYEILPLLFIKSSFGFNSMELNEELLIPISSQRPSSITMGTHNIATGNIKTWIVEPQITYKRTMGIGTFELLAGGSWQNRKQTGHKITGSQYTNDDLLNNMAAAGRLTVSNSISHYAYEAVFGRLGFNRKNKYLANFNIRRDGSSRFGPSNRFANFSSIGGAWIFTEEPVLKKKLKFLSFGKLRMNYGTTGNDQVGDYTYLDSWSNSSYLTYQGMAGILQDKLYNPYLTWESNRKLEAGAEFQFFKNHLFLSASYYRNRSGNQLVFINLPYQTGFSTILKNLNAVIQNTGVEIEISSVNIESKNLKWQSSLNISFPKNKLLEYPGLELSSDRFNYIIGEPLRIQFGYNYNGVNPQTGIYEFQDINSDGIINSLNDLVNNGFRGPLYFGGIQNDINFKNWQANIFFYFIKQTGRNYLTSLISTPGNISNQPRYILDRWQKPGDVSPIQRFTATAGPANTAYSNFRNSSAVLSDASFLRLRNIYVAYNLTNKLPGKIKFEACKLYIQGQNLFTLTNYKGADPETQNPSTLPPLKVFTAGIQITL